ELGPHFGGVLARVPDDGGLTFLSSTLPSEMPDTERVEEISLHRVRVPREGEVWQVHPISLQGLDAKDRSHVGTHVCAILNAAHTKEGPAIVVVTSPEQFFSAYIFGFRADTFEKVWATAGELVTGNASDYSLGNV